jgi:hypothetical protein
MALVRAEHGETRDASGASPHGRLLRNARGDGQPRYFTPAGALAWRPTPAVTRRRPQPTMRTGGRAGVAPTVGWVRHQWSSNGCKLGVTTAPGSIRASDRFARPSTHRVGRTSLLPSATTAASHRSRPKFSPSPTDRVTASSMPRLTSRLTRSTSRSHCCSGPFLGCSRVSSRGCHDMTSSFCRSERPRASLSPYAPADAG